MSAYESSDPADYWVVEETGDPNKPWVLYGKNELAGKIRYVYAEDLTHIRRVVSWVAWCGCSGCLPYTCSLLLKAQEKENCFGEVSL